MGALNVLAQIDEAHPLFELFRRAGFSVYSWEAIWRFQGILPGDTSANTWVEAGPGDENAVRCLFQTLVPPLVQHAEPFANGAVQRWVSKPKEDVLAYVDILTGSAGTCLIPLIHPSVEDVSAILPGLVNRFQQKKKPVYLQVRSYQAWLSDALEITGAAPSPRFALMVKHLVVGQRNPVIDGVRVRSEQRQAEPTAPIMNNYNEHGSQTEGIQ